MNTENSKVDVLKPLFRGGVQYLIDLIGFYDQCLSCVHFTLVANFLLACFLFIQDVMKEKTVAIFQIRLPYFRKLSSKSNVKNF